ncbi:MAG: DMT family transporter [Edaphobacter sp.]|uniref:DMT family transporter n=1 Tax=Edaphobacter sp. TaxID=1934404 RepID=UPI0023A51D0C|nr:DMT family transporter [Edaphobacter sp.]MDE1175150.1 DMT family transporter [Edaphobacter sp.]
MFAAPAILLELSAVYGSETNTSTVFALAPVVTILAWGVTSDMPVTMRLLVPALSGVAGVLLLLSFEAPISVHGGVALAEAAVAMLFVSVASVQLHRLLQGVDVAITLGVACAVNALVLLGWGSSRRELVWHGWSMGLLAAVFIGAIGIGFTIWLLREMDVVRFSTRFFVIPLVTILEGLALVRPELTWRLFAGVGLLLVASVWLLRAETQVDDEVLSLR